MLSTILFTCVAHSSYRWPDSRFQHLTGTRPTNSSTGFSVGRNNQPGPPPTQSAAPFLIAENKRIKVPKIWVHVTQPSPPRLLSVGGRESHKSEHVVSISRLSPPPFHCGGPAPFSAVASHFMPVILVMSIASALLPITAPGQITSFARCPDSYPLYISYTTADAVAFTAARLVAR